GPGIPVTVRPRIFEPFFTTKSPDRGTGLGLSLSRGLVEAHHGTLELDDSSPRTRFVMRLPLTQPTQPRAVGEA
ncbi:MAG TPA: HAMP domain-containing sensor histidine kinase, partial [Kofleriaceae bacterium]|nr:HAMP domain-containing sensor histidine kinase [Kofleriaceae bacterium]